ncbi:hypothetical protein [Cellulomonas sp. NPDC089187]|uniref:hypothetical protein n=1 Tax=Cellulomonas sp. NPDC089187 TaxID=3154970 RepID=UPI0034131FBA
MTESIKPGQSGEALITVTPCAVATTGLVVNDLSGLVQELAQPIENVAPLQLPTLTVTR